MDTTPWDLFLTHLPEAERAEFLEWWGSRPPAIRDLIVQYPPGTIMTFDGRPAFCLGYEEADDGASAGLIFSHVNPGVDPEGARAARFTARVEDLPSGYLLAVALPEAEGGPSWSRSLAAWPGASGRNAHAR